eukprot:CAMPEP_0113675096 /NCGR_PEP_ID=MMETSP0038_2-20120614/7807_1 /TAXON_ID=2898 /ORGANISM="Cryptomonas paramecium" /LENGTH=72 /DNA_ID=CAMNT_0000591795 /DNA_START=18 /DNA_END=236 /DNA_ORIENTATION=- /assembly_acc=CAM_ASM_000170
MRPTKVGQLYYTRFSTNPATRMAGLPTQHHTENHELARIHSELSWMPGSQPAHDSVLGGGIVDEAALYNGTM